MNVSYRWLRAVAPGIDDDPEGVARRLAARGAPVEGIEALAEGLDGVVVARVEDVREHPDADRLSLCTVSAGDAGRDLQVVCGAPNVRAGALYPLAPVGTTLPGGMEVRRAEIRGQASEGMLCSARELGLGTDHTGIMELHGELEEGSPLVEALSLDDWRLDVEVTANRGDLLSHVGVAREVAPDGVAGIRLPAVPGAPEALSLEPVGSGAEARAAGVTLHIEDPDLCTRYLGAVVRGVEVRPSPAWLAARLRAAGSRPINNVVDATNYVLLELGQPLHAFDLATLAESTIVVRRAREGESLVTLDDVERELTTDMLMICDARRPVAIAGVMGGAETEVGEGTTDVLLECAHFEPRQVRSTRSALGMSTDASYRFERGVDPEGMEEALLRAVEIILATAGGEAEPEVADAHPAPFQRPTVELRPSRVGKVLGVPFDGARITELLEPLGFRVTAAGDGDRLAVEVPGFRAGDVTREIDLVEEVARTHGYDSFPERPAVIRPGTVPDHPLFALEDRLRTLLAERGLYEAQTLSLVPEGQGDVPVRNPISTQEAWLRRAVVPSLLARVEHNWARGTPDVRLFELGTCFRPAADGGTGPDERRPREETRLAAVMTGRRAPTHWSAGDEALDLWDLKALLEETVAEARPGATLEPAVDGSGRDGPGWLDGQAAYRVLAGGDTVGWGGLVAADAVDPPPWAGDVLAFELTLPDEPPGPPPLSHRPLPPYPAVERDLALLVPGGVSHATVVGAVRESAGELLSAVRLFDLYTGTGVPEGTRSLAYRLRFQSPDRTLTDAEVDTAVERVTRHLEETLGVRRRG